MNAPWPLDAWPEVPTRFVLCTEDRFFPPDFFRRLVAEHLNIAPDEIAAGHCVALSRPKELAEFLEGYAAEAGIRQGAPQISSTMPTCRRTGTTPMSGSVERVGGRRAGPTRAAPNRASAGRLWQDAFDLGRTAGDHIVQAHAFAFGTASPTL